MREAFLSATDDIVAGSGLMNAEFFQERTMFCWKRDWNFQSETDETGLSCTLSSAFVWEEQRDSAWGRKSWNS